MNCLKLLDDLLVMVKAGEIELGEEAPDAEEELHVIKKIVKESLYNEIVCDVTDIKTEYYAPEYASWREYLSDCDGNADYEDVLFESFEEKELEALWQNSHIAEDMSESKIKDEMLQQIGQLKMISLVSKSASPAKASKAHSLEESMKARIRGLYNMLYE